MCPIKDRTTIISMKTTGCCHLSWKAYFSHKRVLPPLQPAAGSRQDFMSHRPLGTGGRVGLPSPGPDVDLSLNRHTVHHHPHGTCKESSLSTHSSSLDSIPSWQVLSSSARECDCLTLMSCLCALTLLSYFILNIFQSFSSFLSTSYILCFHCSSGVLST